MQVIAAGFDGTSEFLQAQNHYRGWLFARMLGCPSLFHACLAICLAKQQMLLPSLDTEISQQLAHHRGCAIRDLKTNLQDLRRVSELSVVETIIALAHVEVRRSLKIRKGY